MIKTEYTGKFASDATCRIDTEDDGETEFAFEGIWRAWIPGNGNRPETDIF